MGLINKSYLEKENFPDIQMKSFSNENISISENLSNEQTESSKKYKRWKVIQSVNFFGVIARIYKEKVLPAY